MSFYVAHAMVQLHTLLYRTHRWLSVLEISTLRTSSSVAPSYYPPPYCSSTSPS